MTFTPQSQFISFELLFCCSCCCFFVVVVVFDGGLQGVICAAKNSGSFFGGAMVYLFGDDRYKKGAILFDHINYIVSECLIIFFNLMVSRL